MSILYTDTPMVQFDDYRAKSWCDLFDKPDGILEVVYQIKGHKFNQIFGGLFATASEAPR